MSAATKTLAFSIGERVKVNGNFCTTRRESKVVDIRDSIGAPGKVLYVLEDGGWLDESELDSLEYRSKR